MILKTEMAARVTFNVIKDELALQGLHGPHGSVCVPEQEAWSVTRKEHPGQGDRRGVHDPPEELNSLDVWVPAR